MRCTYRYPWGPIPLIAATLLWSACSSEAPPPAASTPAAGPAPAPAPPPAGPLLYVSDETGGAVVVIDATSGQILERIAVGKRPRGIRVSRDGTSVLVALSGSPIAGPGVDESKLPPADRAADGIGVVDLATRKLVRTLTERPGSRSVRSLARWQDDLCVERGDGGDVGARHVERHDSRSRQGRRRARGRDGAARRARGVRHVRGRQRGRGRRYDDAESRRADEDRGATTLGRLHARMASTAFVTDENAATVTVLDTRASTRSTPRSSSRRPRHARRRRGPWARCSRPMACRCIVSLGRARSVAVIDVATRQLVRTIEDVGARRGASTSALTGKKIYTANGPSGDVSVVDLATGTVERRIATGGSPWGLVVK